MAKAQSVTIKDIAKLAGVSVSTVSRALKGHPDISPDTRDKIKSIAELLKYRPSQVAVSLRLKKSNVIGVLLPKVYSFFYPTVVNGIEEVANMHGYHLMILQSSENYQKEVDNAGIFLANGVDGVLATVSRQTKSYEHYQSIIDAGIPVVFFDRVPASPMGDMVLVDDVTGAYQATKHLIEKGRRRIAICIGSPDLLISINRLKGYKIALNDYGIPFDERYLISAESPEEADFKTRELLNQMQPPDSIFAISDLTMSGIMREVYRRKIVVPDQLAVIGFCEDTFCKMYNPQLTSIKPMGGEIGKQAAEQLIKRIKCQENCVTHPETMMIKSVLVQRDST
ncbi:MAG TPA: LacI family transcriptional regulator [Bacteroidales bacterium]|nr:LacI family transcriptional regulator [Bacteroidales bacterium]